ncbi:hypothetical protein QFZ27_003897 [Inquilinus ginsengisoli]
MAALISSGVVDHAADGRVVFPFDATRIDVVLTADVRTEIPL